MNELKNGDPFNSIVEDACTAGSVYQIVAIESVH